MRWYDCRFADGCGGCAAGCPEPGAHGYGLIAEVDRLSDGRVSLRPGTLYGALDRLTDDGHVTADREEVVDGRLRRYYRLTPDGETALRTETERMRRHVHRSTAPTPTSARTRTGLPSGHRYPRIAAAPTGMTPPVYQRPEMESRQAVTSTTFDDHERVQWAGKAAAYRDSFASLCAHPAGPLLDAADVGEGVRVLDVGTGTGTVAVLACGRAAKVIAVDAEPSMLEIARRRAPDAETRHAVLPHLPFPDGRFDAVVANFVINHVGDPGAAIREMRRVVRPGGRLAVTIWPYPPPPAQQLWNTIFDTAGVPRPTDLPKVTPDKDFARNRDGLAALVERAGLVDVRCDTLTWTHRTHPDTWWAGPANGLGTPGTLLLRQDPATIARIRSQYDQHTATYRDADGRLGLPTAALLASASVR